MPPGVRAALAVAVVAALAGASCGGDDDGSGAGADADVRTVALDPVEDPAPGTFVVAADFAELAASGDWPGLEGPPGAIVVDSDGSVLVGVRNEVVRIDGDELTSRDTTGLFAVQSLALDGDGAVVGTAGTSDIFRYEDGTRTTVAGDYPSTADEPLAVGEPLPADTPLPLVLDVAAGDGAVVGAILAVPDVGTPQTTVAQVVRVVGDETVVVAGSRVESCDGAGAPAPAIDAGLGRIGGVAVAPDGSVLASDGDCQRLWRVDADGTLGVAAGPESLTDPHDVVVDGDGTAYVLDHGRSAVVAVAPDGTASVAVGGLPATGSGSQLALDDDGRLWITAGDQVLLARPA